MATEMAKNRVVEFEEPFEAYLELVHVSTNFSKKNQNIGNLLNNFTYNFSFGRKKDPKNTMKHLVNSQ